MLIGEFSRLRIMDGSDAEYVRNLRNSPEVSEFYQHRFFISDLQQEQFVRSLSELNTRIYFIAEKRHSNRKFGVYCLQDINYRDQRADAGAFLDYQQLGNGVAAFEASFLILDYGFRQLNLQKVTGQVLADNERAIRYNAGLGMKQEGVLRKHVFADGRFRDILLYAMFREDFYERPSDVIKRFLEKREPSQEHSDIA